jgi:NADH pyrophosphatase NudC (nudix superfamily)
MGRLIDADDLEMYVYREVAFFCNLDEDVIVDAILKQPTVDAAQVVHGHWVDCNKIKFGGVSGIPVVKCSKCGIHLCDIINNHHVMYRFCPYCGAKMDLEEEP